MKAKTLDEKIDNGEGILNEFDLSKGTRPNQSKRVNVDFPIWMLNSLDKQASILT